MRSEHVSRDKDKSRDINISGLILETLKKFVTKNNIERHKKHGKGQDYSTYNRDVVIQEFIGHKLYSLFVKTPKTYISIDDDTNLQINSAKNPETKTLNHYLCEAINNRFPNEEFKEIKDFHFFTSSKYISIIQEALQKLNGLGELCYAAIWLQDLDVFGKTLDNVLVEGDTIIKIDTSEINLTNVSEEEFNVGLQHLIKNKIYYSQEQMPYFVFIFNLLNKDQHHNGFSAMFNLKPGILEDALTWLESSLGIQLKVFSELESRQREMLGKFELPSKPMHAHINAIKQDIIIRPASDFKSTSEWIKGGNSNPNVSQKVQSLKKNKIELLLLIDSITVQTIKLLQKKLGEIKQSDPKYKLITAAIEAYTTLIQDIQKKINKDKSKDLREIYSKFNLISNKELKEALNPNEIDKILDSISSATAFLLGTKKTVNEEIAALHKSLHEQYTHFFKKLPTLDSPQNKPITKFTRKI